MVNTSIGWNLSKTILRLAEWLRYEKSKLEHQKVIIVLDNHFQSHIVENGYFKGLKYSTLSSVGSSLFPKLSGSYESELHFLFLKIERISYSTIINIGCAEGFYAVGLALKFQKSKIIAFDIDETARKLCAQMAAENNVIVEIQSECTSGFFEKTNQKKRNLILCDCEGYEENLFRKTNIENLRLSDLIIELHPMNSPGIKDKLYHLFRGTHLISYINSYDDARKIADLPTMYQGFKALEKLKLVQEGRSYSMDWMICFSKKYQT